MTMNAKIKLYCTKFAKEEKCIKKMGKNVCPQNPIINLLHIKN